MWQQDPEELSQTAVAACFGMSMPLQGGATLEFRDAQSLGAQTDPRIGAAISSRAPTVQASLRQETRLCVSSAIHFFPKLVCIMSFPSPIVSDLGHIGSGCSSQSVMSECRNLLNVQPPFFAASAKKGATP